MRLPWRLGWAVTTMAALGCSGSEGPPEEPEEEEGVVQGQEAMRYDFHADASGRTVFADVVAIDQMFVYDRLGAFNPGGMVYALRRDVVAADPSKPLGPGNATLRPGKRPRPLVLRVNAGDRLSISFTNWLAPATGALPSTSTLTRDASIQVVGLQIRDIDALGGDVGNGASSLAAPGETRRYELFAGREGTFLMHSGGAMVGSEPGPGRRISQTLYGAVHVEPPGAVAYRSQVTADELAAAELDPPNPDGTPRIDYDAVDDDGEPILKMIDDAGEIVHGDLNAIIAGFEKTEVGTSSSVNMGYFREFTVLFHDILSVVQPIPEYQADPRYNGVRTGFGINYGASSLGSAVFANKRRIGPSKSCEECKFEEFFLSSWVNGDPALNIDRDDAGNAVEALYPDDPSNVSHGYLGDPVRVRNLHAGPSETHVFHLHGHQWLRSPGNDKSAYIDSQTIGPRAAYTYDITYGGGGNRNLTVGDAIYHCHLYAHFAQGMWGLWRTHDVFEAGTPDRSLPDGELAAGTPTPAVVPIPGVALAPMPTYERTSITLPDGKTEQRDAMPGYPFYVAAVAGHRPSQPPRDMEDDGGLPRHIITSVPPGGAARGGRGLFDVQLSKADLQLLPKDGTPPEVAAARFHSGEFPGAVRPPPRYGFPVKGYPAFTAEGAPALFLVNGQPPAAGAPFADPCPPGAPVRTYRTAYVQTNAPVNRAGWHDAQARMIVLEDDVEATLDGTKAPEPMYIRARSGECVEFHATNLLPASLAEDAFQLFTPTDVIGQHIHLVKFDVTASDGGANGFNYEDGALATEEVVARIRAANALGGARSADGRVGRSEDRVILDERTSHPRMVSAPFGAQTTIQRWWADPILSESGPDRAMSTAFTHDHFSASSHQQHGLYGGLVVEPAGSIWRDPETGAVFGERSDGGPTSYRADILFPQGDRRSSFREFNLSLADYGLVYDECGKPVNPPSQAPAPLPMAITHGPPTPDAISWRDAGSGLINYRNEPIPLRIAERNCGTGVVTQKSGDAGAMHNVFSSRVHGDPSTPLLRAYEGDRTLIRLIQGAQAEQHVFTVHGKKWLNEASDPDSGYSNGQVIGVSEQADLALDGAPLFRKNAAGGADYLYAGAPSEDLWEGRWGLLRIHGERQSDLLPLPGAPRLRSRRRAVDVCPPEAPKRPYVVHAITAKGNLPGDRLTYNATYGLYDPDAILYVLEEDLAAMRSGERPPEPLVLRASAGECVEVTLVNDLPEDPPKTPQWDYITPIVDGFNVNQVKASNRISLHPQLVGYDVTASDGANVGQNPDQTVERGKQLTYTWYAGDIAVTARGDVRWQPVELGAVNLKDMADVVNHPRQGAVGALIVEPQDAVWYPSRNSRAAAQVKYRDEFGSEIWFREFVVVYQDEVGLRSDQPAFHCLNPALNCGSALANVFGLPGPDFTGHKAFNYRAEPIWARLGVGPDAPLGVLPSLDVSDVFSSAGRGDPATPIFSAGRWDRVRFRVLQASGHRRQHSFGLSNTEWAYNPWAQGSESRYMGRNSKSFAVGAQGGIGPMTAWNVIPYFRSGGMFEIPGDRLYLDQSNAMLTGGLWGIWRVTP
ncbi:copper oxidase [Sorangium sp. So ce1000]|uniref:copper oxidase n=1 Tax=Sorangium sp. So ce1000 TaxID=3133325 RepID=UPI003F5F287E